MFFSCGSASQKEDCSLYRKGSFNSHIRSEHTDYFFKFVRDDSIQMETEEKTGDKATFRIVWTSPCEYELFLLTTTRKVPDSIIQRAKSHPLKTTIVSGTNDYYLFESTSEGSTHILKDTIWLDRRLPEKMPADHYSH